MNKERDSLTFRHKTVDGFIYSKKTIDKPITQSI